MMTIGERHPVTSSLIIVAESPSGERDFKALRISALWIRIGIQRDFVEEGVIGTLILFIITSWYDVLRAMSSSW